MIHTFRLDLFVAFASMENPTVGKYMDAMRTSVRLTTGIMEWIYVTGMFLGEWDIRECLVLPNLCYSCIGAFST